MVNLSRFNPLSPVEVGRRRQQVIGIGSDLKEPLAQALLANQGVIRPILAPATAANNLGIGQNRLADVTPPLLTKFLISQALVVKLEEEPLGPTVVINTGGIDLPGPVITETQSLILAAVVSQSLVGDLSRRSPGL